MLFGKLPSHGDFIARGLDPARRQALDEWLASALAEAQDVHGDTFEPRYDSAPAWRFAWEESEGWLAGAMAPSMDSVGRRFPILVAAHTGERSAAAGLAQACEDAIYQAFARGLDADALHAGLIALAEEARAPKPLPGWWTAGNDAFPAARLEGERPQGLFAMMLGAGEQA
ncbi:type VI secretion system protein ImpM [Sphingomonas jatrophae]|uniref:Type VI secretion system protein ImpM n=2 Tax=Sphingomonas jatrophae TaxID=1166337 RepID=A0A1I6LKF1_9SPHN|nr:type VI secretion system protein ImpM [Sphingomonas jatrophae]